MAKVEIQDILEKYRNQAKIDELVIPDDMPMTGGFAVTLDIMSNMENASFEEYFINLAKIWCVKARPEFLQLLLSIDVHGPNILRANIPPRNFEK